MQSFDKKKAHYGWSMFDWANSAYYLIINSTIFPILFKNVIDDGSTVFGIEIKSKQATYDFTISIAFAIIIFLSPLLSGIADASGKKKSFMKMFTWIGAFSCFALYFFDVDFKEIGIIATITGLIGYSGSILFYNAYLPIIADKNEQDRLSGRGFAMGYLGSSLLLLTIVFFAFNPALIGYESAIDIYYIGFVAVGVWWILFSQITFKHLPDNPFRKSIKSGYFKKGMAELSKCYLVLTKDEFLKKYLWMYFLMSLGLQTLIIIAPLFAMEELDIEASELILVVLIMQFSGAIGAWVISKIASRSNNIKTLFIPTIILITICSSVVLVNSFASFAIVGVLLGFAMAGAQSLTRSTFSQILPKTEDHASFFSFFDVAEKSAIMSGTLIVGIINYIFPGNAQLGIFFLAAIFIITLLILRSLQNDSKTKNFEQNI